MVVVKIYWELLGLPNEGGFNSRIRLLGHIFNCYGGVRVAFRYGVTKYSSTQVLFGSVLYIMLI